MVHSAPWFSLYSVVERQMIYQGDGVSSATFVLADLRRMGLKHHNRFAMGAVQCYNQVNEEQVNEDLGNKTLDSHTIFLLLRLEKFCCCGLREQT